MWEIFLNTLDDLDDDNDGTPDDDDMDDDGDGIPDHADMDRDSDGDGIADVGKRNKSTWLNIKKINIQ